MLSPEVLSTKIKEYESFLEETLKKDLSDVQKVLKDKVEQYKEWEEVKEVAKTLKEFKEKDRNMDVRVEIGSGVHVQGEVTDYERTYICIGLGLMLEMDCEEASKYADIRMRSLKRDIDHYRKMAVGVKVNIKMVLLAINELQNSIIKK